MGRNPFVYIIVLAWNGIEHTRECIRSLLETDYSNYRVLVVDNGSSDGTAGIIKSEFLDVEVIENGSNLGYAEGNNVGLKHAADRGAEFFFVLNNDTIVDPSAIRILVNATSQNETDFICTPAIYDYSSPERPAFLGNYWDSRTFRFRTVENFQQASSVTTVEMIPTAFAPGCSLFFGVAVLTKVGLFDSRFFLYWEDTDWGCRAAHQGCQSFIVPTARIWHKESQSFAERSQKLGYHYYYFRNRLLWIEKNFKGSDRWRGQFRALLELLKPLHPAHGASMTDGRWIVLRARLLGFCHYMIRRFGPL